MNNPTTTDFQSRQDSKTDHKSSQWAMQVFNWHRCSALRGYEGMYSGFCDWHPSSLTVPESSTETQPSLPLSLSSLLTNIHRFHSSINSRTSYQVNLSAGRLPSHLSIRLQRRIQSERARVQSMFVTDSVFDHVVHFPGIYIRRIINKRCVRVTSTKSQSP